MLLRTKKLLIAPPAWVLRGIVPATIDFDFANNRLYQAAIGASTVSATDPRFLTVSRASTGYASDSLGNWTSFGSNVARITSQGLLVEDARTNVVLWNRDLTNAAWTKTNVTAALDQAGIDGTANAASSITATAGNGTALQAITLASSARFQSAFVKRITGSGTVNMTMDNGSTWTAIAVTSAWTRVSIATQTLANPTVGFQLVTNSDKIAVDFVQNENGTFWTSPILVTTAAAPRAADVITLVNPPTFGTAYSVYAAGTPQATNSAGNQIVVAIDAGSNNNRFLLYRSAGGAHVFNSSAGVGVDISAGAWNQGVFGKLAATTTQGAQAASFNGGAIGTTAGNLPVGVNAVRFGSDVTTANFFNGTISRTAIWPTTRQPNSILQQLTL